MKLSSVRVSHRIAAAVAVLGGVAAALVALPSRGQETPPGQQPTPAPADAPVIQVTVPATRTLGAITQVDYQFTLPSGYELIGPPRVRSVDASGELTELLPMYILQRSPTWAGLRGLHTSAYPPGTYQVTIEVTYQGPDGVTKIAISPARSLTVPAATPQPGGAS
jgi:hypothetical protein